MYFQKVKVVTNSKRNKIKIFKNMYSQKPQIIESSSKIIASNKNKLSYDQLLLCIKILLALTCCLIFFIFVLQVNIWVLEENSVLLNAKIEELLVEQQSEAKKNSRLLLKAKKALVTAQHNDATMTFASGYFAVVALIAASMFFLK